VRNVLKKKDYLPDVSPENLVMCFSKYVRSKTLMANWNNKITSGFQTYQVVKNHRRFMNHFCSRQGVCVCVWGREREALGNQTTSDKSTKARCLTEGKTPSRVNTFLRTKHIGGNENPCLLDHNSRCACAYGIFMVAEGIDLQTRGCCN
jgi:hypothetical protein